MYVHYVENIFWSKLLQLYQLYFGTNIPNSQRIIQKQEIIAFLNSYYTGDGSGLFGYTLIQVDGYWHGENETSFIVQIAIDEPILVTMIGTDYKLTFFQESVMLVLPSGLVTFIEV